MLALLSTTGHVTQLTIVAFTVLDLIWFDDLLRPILTTIGVRTAMNSINFVKIAQSTHL